MQPPNIQVIFVAFEDIYLLRVKTQTFVVDADSHVHPETLSEATKINFLLCQQHAFLVLFETTSILSNVYLVSSSLNTLCLFVLIKLSLENAGILPKVHEYSISLFVAVLNSTKIGTILVFFQC